MIFGVKFRVIGTLKVLLINGKNLSIAIDFGIGIDQNSWYRTGIVSKPKSWYRPSLTVAVPCKIMCVRHLGLEA